MGCWFRNLLLALLCTCTGGVMAKGSGTYALDVQMQLAGPASAEGGSVISYALNLSVPKVVSSVPNFGKSRLVVTFDAPSTLAALSVVPASTRFWSCNISGSKVTCSCIRNMAVASKKSNKIISVATVTGFVPNATATLTATATTAIGAGSPTFNDTVAANNTVTLSTAVTAQVVLAPAAFNAFDTSTASGAVTGKLTTRIAGNALPVAVIAVGSGSKVNTGFAGTVTVEALNAEDNSGAYDANNCRSTWTAVIASTSGALSGGRSNFTLPAVADVYRDVRIRVTGVSGGVTVRGCSIDRFAIRPASFVVTVTDSDASTAGTSRSLGNTAASGGNVHYAEAPFTVRVTAVGTTGAPVPRYPQVITALPALSVASVLVPAGAASGSVSATLDVSGVSGELRADDAIFDDVGSISLSVDDDSFSQVDAVDGSASTVTRITGTANAGRFVPASFQLDPVLDPVMTVATESGCAAPTAAYLGQAVTYAMVPSWLVTPLGAAGNAVENYTGSLWKLAAAAPTTKCPAGAHTCSASAGSVVLAMQYSTSSGATPDWDAGASSFGTPVLKDNGDGTGTLTLNAADRFTLNRPATPVPPFVLTHTLSVTVQDTSESVSIASPTLVTPVIVGSDSFEFRFGQLKIANAYGPEGIDLPLHIEAQYWNGNGFVTNRADSCTRLLASDFALSGFRGGLSGCKAALSVPGSGRLTAGVGTARVLTGKVSGSISISVNLIGSGGASCAARGAANAGTATGAARPWLLGKWAGSRKYDRNPSANVTFGIQHGADRVIQIREVF